MADSGPNPISHVRQENGAPDVIPRGDAEGGGVYVERSDHLHHHKETHGLRDDIDEDTPLSDVKAPNVFERAKEEIQALAQAIHSKKDSEKHEKRDQNVEVKHAKDDVMSPSEEDDVKSPNFFERAKEELKGMMKSKNSPRHHHKETHGTSDDINDDTPINEVKGPSVFERAKEEIEALVVSIHPKKESNDKVSSSKKEGGLGSSIGRRLEKVCSPCGHKRDQL